ncbi:hypothetical protein [Georgenia sp. SUBG003]|uniref:hypothetical protein n=1 Tax=Georgenia sp. SUBG003 TaxID=1497974 RepID=UPI003AB739F3
MSAAISCTQLYRVGSLISRPLISTAVRGAESVIVILLSSDVSSERCSTPVSTVRSSEDSFQATLGVKRRKFRYRQPMSVESPSDKTTRASADPLVLGRRIRHARTSRGMTLRELASAVGSTAAR